MLRQPIDIGFGKKRKGFSFFFDYIFSYCARIVMPNVVKEPFRLGEYSQTFKPDDVLRSLNVYSDVSAERNAIRLTRDQVRLHGAPYRSQMSGAMTAVGAPSQTWDIPFRITRGG